MSEEFKDAPVSISEARAHRTKGGGNLWTVRDMLISVLRQIDRGEIKPTYASLVLCTETDDSKTVMDYAQVSKDTLHLLGMLVRAQHELDN